MSIPRDILDQLLSGYLDDVLGDDEQIRVEQLLRDDSEVAKELEDLRLIRSTLRQISRVDANVRLDDGFADRVMQAAVAQASAEGLGEDHPLLKVAEHPSVPERQNSLSVGKIAGAIVALAASITIAIVMWQPPEQGAENGLQQSVGIAGGLASADPVDADPAGERPAGEQPAGEVPDAQSASMLAELVPDVSLPTDAIASAEAIVENVLAEPAEAVALELKPSPSEKMVAAAASPKTSKMPTEAEAAELLGASNVLTLLVNRTEQGRQSRAVREAMQGASIALAEEKNLTESMVSAVAASLEDTDQPASPTQLLFLEVPAKKVDVFVAKLAADEQGIKSVQYGLVASPAVKRFVKSINATTVNHSRSWEFRGRGVSKIADQFASGQSFLPAGSMRGIPLTSGASSDGPDILSRILILVR